MKSLSFILILVVATILAVGFTFNYAVEFSGFAAGLAKSVLAIALFVAFDKFVLKQIDTIREIKSGNVAMGLLLLAVALIFAANTATAADHDPTPYHLEIALDQVGTTESGINGGAAVDRYLASVGLGTGYPYCAAFVSWAIDSADVCTPSVRSARAQAFITDRSINAKHVLRGSYEPSSGDILIFKKGNTIYGHVGFVIRWDEKHGHTVEANTSPGDTGRQRDGDGVWIRERSIQPLNYFRITHFTPVRYNGNR
jgi:hypothetical protein